MGIDQEGPSVSPVPAAPLDSSPRVRIARTDFEVSSACDGEKSLGRARRLVRRESFGVGWIGAND
jgi:hypothetical protein